MFDRVIDVLRTKFEFEDKDVARRYFLELRLIFTNLNYAPYESDKFKELEQQMNEKISERTAKNA